MVVAGRSRRGRRGICAVTVHDASRAGRAAVPEHVVIPPALSGVESPIILLLGNRFPMIGAHKVLAAYSCLAPRLVTGQFDPTENRAVWPSTGNYARGGIAISKIMGCRGVAVLPEGMSAERFEWLPGDLGSLRIDPHPRSERTSRRSTTPRGAGRRRASDPQHSSANTATTWAT